MAWSAASASVLALLSACDGSSGTTPDGDASAGTAATQGGEQNRAGAGFTAFGGSSGVEVAAGSAGLALAGSGGTTAVAGSAGAPTTAAGSGGSGGSGGGSPAGGGAGASGGAGRGGTSAGTGGAPAAAGQAGASGQSGSDGGGAYHPCPADGSACKIMPFGDSITDGFGTDGSYRIELFRLANEAGKHITFVGSQSNGPGMVDGVPFPPAHEGHSGFTIYPTPSRSGISPFVDSSIPQYKPHIITLMIGTNDAIDDYQMANAPARLGMLIDSIFVKLPDVLLVVAEPIPSQDDALNTRLRTYGSSIPPLVKARADAGKHILVVDMYTPFAAVANYKTTLLKDTWHPNVAGDVILGQRWFTVLAPFL